MAVATLITLSTVTTPEPSRCHDIPHLFRLVEPAVLLQMPDQDAAGKAAGAGVTLRPRRTQDKRRCGTEEPRQYLVAAVTGWVNRSLATATARRPCKLGARSK